MAQNRRIGQRYRIPPGIVIDWAIEQRRGRWRRKTAQAVIEDLSLSGALIRAAVPPVFGVGRQVVIGCDGGRAVVQVRRVIPLTDGGWVRYGVLFLQLDEAFTHIINDVVRAESSDYVDWR
jgi:hypothetical protein